MTILIGSACDYNQAMGDRVYFSALRAQDASVHIASFSDWECLGEYTVEADGTYATKDEIDLAVKAGLFYQIFWGDDGKVYWRELHPETVATTHRE